MHHQSHRQSGGIQRNSESQAGTAGSGRTAGGGQFRSSDQRGQSMGQGGGPRFQTRNYLPEEVRAATCQRLNQVLADTTALRTQATYAHWNVKGMHFYQFHELFEEIADALAEQEDLIAERITALGGQAQGTVQQAAALSRIPEMPPETTIGHEFVEQLASRLATHDANLYEDIRAAEEYDDLDTADLLNEISREVSHYLWFLESHLQGQSVERPPGQGMGGQGMGSQQIGGQRQQW